MSGGIGISDRLVNFLALLPVFAPTIMIVLMGIRGMRIHVNAICIVGIYTMVWGIVVLILTLVFDTSSLLIPIFLIFTIFVVGAMLIASKRDIRLAKLSAIIAMVAWILLPFTM